MRRFLRLGLFLIFILFACSPQPDAVHVVEPIGIPSSVASPQPAAHAPDIRFALIGEAQQVNVWGLFDGTGSTYANRALLDGNWPRLYHLAPADLSFQPLAAEGLPSEVIQDGGEYSATVKLRTDLKWTDDSSFTADDVAFTANTILAFEFDYDWGAFYPRGYLARVEALDPSTVKFVFKQKPNVGVWQYGVLQAPVVQKTFWESAVQEAASGLTDQTLRTKIADTRASLEVAQTYFADLEAQVNALRFSGKKDQPIERDYKKAQGEMVYLQAALDNLLEDYAVQVKSAQEALHKSDDDGEPTLGAWVPDLKSDKVWENKINPNFPFGRPNFDRVSYIFFEDETAALTAFQNGEVDFILSPVDDLPAEAKFSPSYSARFIIFNPLNGYLADPAIRSAFSCIIDRHVLTADVLQNKAAPFDSFVISAQWHDANLKNPCTDLEKSARVAYAVQALKDAGYSWAQEPDSQNAGQGLFMPNNGGGVPKITLLAPSKDEDALRYAAAKYIAEQAQYLGIPFAVSEAGLDEVVYAVYSSGKYDMALMGWRLSEYPAYLCEWFGGTNPLLYNSDRFGRVCEALGAETNLEAAHRIVAQIESELTSELPFIPLFTVMQADVYRNLSYPVPMIPNGWTSLYGAPSYAIPVP
jgi:ABC-type transport system substrate-binding protein